MQTDDFVLTGYSSSSELQVCCSKLRNKACRHSQNAAGDKREKDRAKRTFREMP